MYLIMRITCMACGQKYRFSGLLGKPSSVAMEQNSGNSVINKSPLVIQLIQQTMANSLLAPCILCQHIIKVNFPDRFQKGFFCLLIPYLRDIPHTFTSKFSYFNAVCTVHYKGKNSSLLSLESHMPMTCFHIKYRFQFDFCLFRAVLSV